MLFFKGYDARKSAVRPKARGRLISRDQAEAELDCKAAARFETRAARYTETRPLNGILPSAFGILLKLREANHSVSGEGDPRTFTTQAIRTSSLRGDR